MLPHPASPTVRLMHLSPRYVNGLTGSVTGRDGRGMVEVTLDAGSSAKVTGRARSRFRPDEQGMVTIAGLPPACVVPV